MQHEQMSCKQHQSAGVKEMLRNTPHSDIGEVGDGLEIGSIGESKGDDDDERTEQSEHPGQPIPTAPSQQLSVVRPATRRCSIGTRSVCLS